MTQSVGDPRLLFPVVAIYGFSHGGFFTVVSPIVAEYFGLRAHGAIFGTVLFFGTLGGSVGPILAGLAFDRTGSYQIAFAGLLGLSVYFYLPWRYSMQPAFNYAGHYTASGQFIPVNLHTPAGLWWLGIV